MPLDLGHINHKGYVKKTMKPLELSHINHIE